MKSISKRFIALGVYVVFLLVFFFFARFFFIFTHYQEAFQFSVTALASTFWHGIRLDISATAYILALPLLATVAGIWITGNWFRRFIDWYTLLIILASALIIAGDTTLYTYWGFRMDFTALAYLKTPQDAAASVTTFQIIGFCFTVAGITFLFMLLYKKFVERFFRDQGTEWREIPATLLFTVFWGTLVIPIRGGLGDTPVNASTAYFSDSMFLNHTAVNVIWNVGSSVFHRNSSVNPYAFGELSGARTIVESITGNKGTPEKVLNNPVPNILFIILESFGNSLVGPLGGDPLTTPELNQLTSEGVLFSNFYASGNRTEKALPAILNGYPAQPATSIINEEKKTQSLSSLVKIMNGLNYNSSFWYGGDLNFANFNSFITGSGFHKIITKNNFDPADCKSKWGVHDDVLFEALKDSMKTISEPFFNVVLTLSSHEPFGVPMEPVFKGKDILTKFKNSVYFTDKSLGDFINWAKTTGWWKNTLVILIADHCRRNSPVDFVYSQDIYKIPMLWIGGAVNENGKIVQKLGNQVDIPITLLDQLDLPGDFPFGKDLLSEESNSFAFYCFNEGFGFITDTSTVIYDHKLGRPVLEEGKNPERAELFGKSYLQVLYDDYLKR